MNIPSLIGSVAAFCTTVAFLPQVVKTARTRHTRDISLLYTSITLFGVFCWLVYGWLIRDFPLIAANAVTLVMVGVIFSYKLKFG